MNKDTILSGLAMLQCAHNSINFRLTQGGSALSLSKVNKKLNTGVVDESCFFSSDVIGRFQLSCQRSASVSDDSDTGDRHTYTDVSTSSDSTDTESNDDSDSGDSSSSNDTTTEDTDQDTGSDTTPLPDPVENEWIFIEGGSFEMGSELFEYSQPVHTVTVPSFEIQKTEVTTHQFRQCVDAGACSEPDAAGTGCEYNRNNWLVADRKNNPVNCVSHSLASDYCSWLGGRLPSETEWEYAARSGGQDIIYPWGNDEPSCDLAVMMRAEEFPCYSEDSLPVCSVPEGNTVHGLCDMAGNFLEWVADRVPASSDYSGAPADGSPHVIAGAEDAVFRGGSSDSSPLGVHVSNRWYDSVSPVFATTLTFRCVRDILK